MPSPSRLIHDLDGHVWDATVAICDVDGVPADAVAVEALARLQLAARRHGCQVVLRNASPELRELLAFMALDGVLPG